MTVITRRTLARTAAARWDEQYKRPHRTPEQLGISEQLNALGRNPDPDAVNAITGNNSWTSPPMCDECKVETPPAVVQVGDEPDYDSNTAHLCRACAEKAFNLIAAETTM